MPVGEASRGARHRHGGYRREGATGARQRLRPAHRQPRSSLRPGGEGRDRRTGCRRGVRRAGPAGRAGELRGAGQYRPLGELRSRHRSVAATRSGPAVGQVAPGIAPGAVPLHGRSGAPASHGGQRLLPVRARRAPGEPASPLSVVGGRNGPERPGEPPDRRLDRASYIGRAQDLYLGLSFQPAFQETIMDDKTRTELEAAAFRRLVEHLQKRTDVQNIDLMNLAGFCRNCLSRWYREEAGTRGIEIADHKAREIVYGMPYDEWKTKYQKEASGEQKKAYDKAGHKHG